MIDWLTFVAPLAHEPGEGGPLWCGQVLSTVPDPEQGEAIAWAVWKRRQLEGSHSSVIQVQSTTLEGRPAIWVSGNPAKWFQGHNVFGSDDLAGLVLEMLHRICGSLSITPTADDLADWHAGNVHLSRVDLTRSIQLGTRARVRNALRALDSTARLKHRGRGHFHGDSLLFGKGSRRWSLTLYAKGPELDLHKLPLMLAETSIPQHADGLLRVELRLLAMQLAEEQHSTVASWGEFTPEELHRRYTEGLEIADASMLDAATLDGLPGRLQLAYTSWREGHDLRAILPRNTFYRYRTELLKHGVDIGVKQERTGPDMANVVPLRAVITGEAVEVPAWALGTPLYFEPRRRFA